MSFVADAGGSLGGVANEAFGGVGSVVGGTMGGIGGGIAKYAPQNGYRAGNQQQFDLDRQKAAAFYSGLPDQLNAQANGTGPSAADAYLFNANQQATNQANALAQSARGGVSPAMALRMAQNSSAGASAQNAGTYSTMKNQEAINAINQKAQLSSFYDQLGQGGVMQAQGINAGISNNNTNAAANFGGQGMATLGQMAGAAGKMAGGAAHGGIIPGVAPHPGDDPRNDISPVPVSPGEGVIPRSKMADPKKAHEFLDVMLSEQGEKEDDGFDALLKAHHALKRKVKALEATRG